MWEWVGEQVNWINTFDGFFAEIVKGFIPVFFGIWLSVKLALKKFVTEKWWERKAEAYEKVITAVYYSFRYYDEELHATSRKAEVDKTTMDEILAHSKQGDKDIVEAMTIGTLKLSQAALDRLNKFRSEQSIARQKTNWTEHLIMSHDAHSNCLKELVELAKEDLGLK